MSSIKYVNTLVQQDNNYWSIDCGVSAFNKAGPNSLWIYYKNNDGRNPEYLDVTVYVDKQEGGGWALAKTLVLPNDGLSYRVIFDDVPNGNISVWGATNPSQELILPSCNFSISNIPNPVAQIIPSHLECNFEGICRRVQGIGQDTCGSEFSYCCATETNGQSQLNCCPGLVKCNGVCKQSCPLDLEKVSQEGQFVLDMNTIYLIGGALGLLVLLVALKL